MKELFLEAVRGVLPLSIQNKVEDKIIAEKIISTYKLLKKIAKKEKIFTSTDNNAKIKA